MVTKQDIRAAAEADLETFVRLVAPERVLGSVHCELFRWWTREDSKSHQLVLLPRDHGKSQCVAYRVAWELTRNPTLRILYISATANLAEKQLSFIKQIMTSEIYREFWPEMVNTNESDRQRWTNSEICVDHPLRKAENVRDPSIFTGGLTTSLTGMHCDIAVLDDVVVYENAYVQEGRTKVKSQYSLLSSIEGAEAQEWIVGTRYHPNDLYSEIVEMTEEVFDKEGNIIDTVPIYETFERKVESRGDGTGEFLWPRQQRDDGKWFGFDRQILAKKRGKYMNKTQFYAQYYNSPEDPAGSGIDRAKFQYYEKNFLTLKGNTWYYKDVQLNVYASIDFAYSVSKRSDYTALVVVGVDHANNVYVLDIDRFKTDKISVYFEHIRSMLVKWGFRKLRAEVTAAQQAIVRELKDNYIRSEGLQLSIDEHKPNRYQGSKEERMNAILEPRYDNLQMWHYQGGNCQTLEDELILSNPPHDDVKDALASAIEIAVPPVSSFRSKSQSNVVYSGRFGGVV